MFDRIAGRYDRVNRVMTFGMDQRWRRRVVAQLGVASDDVVLDVASGTGDFAQISRERAQSVISLDFAREMLRMQAARLEGDALLQGDAARMPLADGSVTVIVCGFALRNFTEVEPVLGEMARVLSPGGRVGLLEVSEPRSGIVRRGHSVYFNRIVPLVGGVLSDRQAYRYLPESVTYLPSPAELRDMLRRSGFVGIRRETFSFGATQAIYAVRAG